MNFLLKMFQYFVFVFILGVNVGVGAAEQRHVDSLETHTPAAQWRHEPPQGNNCHLFHC